MHIRSLAYLVGLAVAAPAQADDFDSCLGRLRGEFAAKGTSGATFDRHTQGLQPDTGVLELMDAQPEFKQPIWDYLAGLVDEERIADGRAGLRQWASVLGDAERRFGVDPATVVAVWGVESDFGKTLGKRPLVTSLATLSCMGRRQGYFQEEFAATLRLLQDGDVNPAHLVGSWAGAFGHTQFMPSTYRRIAVDMDGDGRRDLVDSIPDALGSTANYLHKSGWQRGEPWGYEVRVPAGLDTSLAGRTKKRPLSDWVRRGITRVDGHPLEGAKTSAALLLPAGAEGPGFLVFRNFDAIYSYNAAESYALAIAHLSDRLRGGGPFVTPWPTPDPGLSRAERRELQTRLVERGYQIGNVDGIIGANTREALLDVQRKQGLPADGRAGRRILEALRGKP